MLAQMPTLVKYHELPVNVTMYEVTTQELLSNPDKALVIDTRDVLTMVISMSERNRQRHSLITSITDHRQFGVLYAHQGCPMEAPACEVLYFS